MGETYAVIGSNSFTGSHIVDGILSASRDAAVAGISRSPEYHAIFLPYKRHVSSRFEFHQIDLVKEPDTLLKLLDHIRPSIVINVAALSEVALSNHSPIEYFQTNTIGTVRLCNHLRNAPYLDRYVHISSAEIFGACSEPVSEEHLFNPSTPYAVSKAAADMYINTLMRTFDFPATIIRSTNVYGRFQQLFKIIPRTFINLNLGQRIQLHGGGSAIKSFIHIRDVVSGLLTATSLGRDGTYHFSVSSDATVADVVRQICQLMGRDFDDATEVVGERLGQDARYWLDTRKAETELKWKPLVCFEDGLRETHDWIEQNWDVIERQPQNYIHKS